MNVDNIIMRVISERPVIRVMLSNPRLHIPIGSGTDNTSPLSSSCHPICHETPQCFLTNIQLQGPSTKAFRADTKTQQNHQIFFPAKAWQNKHKTSSRTFTFNSSDAPGTCKSAAYISAEKHWGVSKCTDMLPSLVSMVNHAGTLTCSPSSTNLSDMRSLLVLQYQFSQTNHELIRKSVLRST